MSAPTREEPWTMGGVRRVGGSNGTDGNREEEEGAGERPPIFGMNEAFRAVADGTRRKILQLLREGDLTAGEIASQFEMSWPSISHHLKVLRQAKLVRADRHGQEWIYSLNTTVVQEFLADVVALFGHKEDDDGAQD